MTLSITFAPAATTDVIDAVRWYEAQRAGLGATFYSEIARLTTLAATHPTRYPLIVKDIRRVTLRRFPYSIYFRATSARIVVLAV